MSFILLTGWPAKLSEVRRLFSKVMCFIGVMGGKGLFMSGHVRGQTALWCQFFHSGFWGSNSVVSLWWQVLFPSELSIPLAQVLDIAYICSKQDELT